MAPTDPPSPGTNPATPPPSSTEYPDLTQQNEEQKEELRRPRRPRPKHEFPETQAGKMWKAFGNPEGGPVNEMPGGTFNTAGGKPKEPTWRDAFNYDVFNNPNKPAFYQSACARDSLLVGIGAGGAVGGLRFIIRGLNKSYVTTNYAVATFALAATGMHVWCSRRRAEEAKGMAAAVVGMKMLHEKRAREEAEKKKLDEERRRLEEEERIRSKRWWNPWS
ncbi:hypothetical protein PMZ80_008033 [Knufia obscura]|uniref:Cytochrome c oxidase assembly protein COX20, mitochondrial n=1 Tax=Knufia obscura TaxID=1635080 RepID=A0ABR0RHS1_9EURO|nr:hypothetical protein PMZ80_008033 [Knufia obscura]